MLIKVVTSGTLCEYLHWYLRYIFFLQIQVHKYTNMLQRILCLINMLILNDFKFKSYLLKHVIRKLEKKIEPIVYGVLACTNTHTKHVMWGNSIKSWKKSWTFFTTRPPFFCCNPASEKIGTISEIHPSWSFNPMAYKTHMKRISLCLRLWHIYR